METYPLVCCCSVLAIILHMTIQTSAVDPNVEGFDPCLFLSGALYAAGKCFWVDTQQITWLQAMAYCSNTASGGVLAEPKTQEEWDVLDILTVTSNIYHIGAVLVPSGSGAAMWFKSMVTISTLSFSNYASESLSAIAYDFSRSELTYVTETSLFPYICEKEVGNPCDYFLPAAEYKNGRCLLVLANERMSWWDAQAACEEKGAFLAKLHDTSQLETLVDVIKRHTNDNNIWVGGEYISSQDINRWAWSGQEISVNHIWSNLAEINSVIRMHDSKIHDMPTSRLYFYICQKDIGDPCELDYNGARFMYGKCLKLYFQRITYAGAITACEVHDAILVEPKTNGPFSSLHDYMTIVKASPQNNGLLGVNPHAFIGAKDEIENGRFIWNSDGTPVPDHYWSQLDNSETTWKNAAVLRLETNTTFWLGDNNTNDIAFYICQKDVTTKTNTTYILVLPEHQQGEPTLSVVSTFSSFPVYMYVVLNSDSEVSRLKTFIQANLTWEAGFSLQDIFMTQASPFGFYTGHLQISTSHPVSLNVYWYGVSGAETLLIYPDFLQSQRIGPMSYFVASAVPSQYSTNEMAVTALHSGVTQLYIDTYCYENGERYDCLNSPFRSSDPVTVVLTSQYQTFYVVQSYDPHSVFVMASQPVTVFFGSNPTNGVESKDERIWEQALPTDYIGSRYITFPSLPLDQVRTDRFVVVAASNSTVITYFNSAETLTHVGERSNLQSLTSDNFYVLEGNKPFYAFHYSSHDVGSINDQTSCISSLLPETLWQYRYSHTFTYLNRDDYSVYVNLIVPLEYRNSIVFTSKEGRTLSVDTCKEVVGDTWYLGCVVTVPQTDTAFSIHLDNYGARFGAYVFVWNNKDDRTMCAPLGLDHLNPSAYSDYAEEDVVSDTRVDFQNFEVRADVTTSYPNTVIKTTMVSSGEATSEKTQTPVISTITTTLSPVSVVYPVSGIVSTHVTNTGSTASLTGVNSQVSAFTSVASYTATPTYASALTSEEEKRLVEEIQQRLHVDPKDTSSHRRRKFSVEDDRTSLTTIGLVGVIIAVFACILLLDLITLYRSVSSIHGKIRKK